MFCFRLNILWMVVWMAAVHQVDAQLPVCSGMANGTLYIHATTGIIYNYDPSQPVVVGTNPSENTINPLSSVIFPAGLAVCNNVNGSGPSPTFYTMQGGGGEIWYYNGSSWVNTGHSGGADAFQMTGGGAYVYTFSASDGVIRRYDGTGDALTVLTIPDYIGPWDIAADCSGNIYVLNTGGINGKWLRLYNPSGNLLKEWTLNGLSAPLYGGGGGMAILGNTVYFTFRDIRYTTDSLVTAIIGDTAITITDIGVGPWHNFGPYAPGDFASCPAVNVLSADVDTAYYCTGGAPVKVRAIGWGQPTWTVISGNAVVNGSGTEVTITAPQAGVSKIRLSTVTNMAACVADVADTVTIIAAAATLNAGISPDTAGGCGQYNHVLNASMTDTLVGIVYYRAWSPVSSVVSDGHTLRPIVNPGVNTIYTLTVTTPAEQGGCVWKDSVSVIVKDRTVSAAFADSVLWGCQEDTVLLRDLSAGSTDAYWLLGDGRLSRLSHPVVIFRSQGIYDIILVASNDVCSDTVVRSIDTRHPLVASFIASPGIICQGEEVLFDNNSTAETRNGIVPQFYWDFGDGSSATSISPSHLFSEPGTYKVTLVVTDFTSCKDTAQHEIIADAPADASLTVNDTLLCEGESILFEADYVVEGNTAIKWDFGDGGELQHTSPLVHSFDTSGVITVKLTASYRACPEVIATQTLSVQPYPRIDLGNDTTICPGSSMVRLTDHINLQNEDADYLWNTGATQFSILADIAGTYYATVTLNGCTAADTVKVSNDCYLNIPNVFTPNGDGVNDYFFPRQMLSSALVQFRMHLFDRWGNLLFETRQVDGKGWDGKLNEKAQDAGVYIYLIEAAYANGISERYQGNVTLIR